MPTYLRALPPSRPADAEPARETALERATLKIVPWPDQVIDALGYDPRSRYAEQFWLGVIGPTCAWLMRLLVARLDVEPAGFDLDLAETARALGVGSCELRNSPFPRALTRCRSFGLARNQSDGVMAVRRRLPPLPRRHLIRLPRSVQEQHSNWLDAQRNSRRFEDLRSRSRRMALGLLEIGEDREGVEVYLHRWRVHPALAHEAAEWAWAFRASAVLDESALRVRPASPPDPVTPWSSVINTSFT